MEADIKINQADIERIRKESPERIRSALFSGMTAAMEAAERFAVSAVSGSVLKPETGLLRKSIRGDVRQLDYWTIGNLKLDPDAYYGRIWESGITGPVKVKAYSRIIRKAFGRTIEPVSVKVSGFKRQIKEKARMFRTPAIEKAESVFEQEFNRAMQEGAE